MAGKSIVDRLAETEQRIRQLQARKQTLEQQVKQQERKERTRRLIQIGAIMSNLGVDSVEKALALQKEFTERQEVRAWLDKILAVSKP